MRFCTATMLAAAATPSWPDVSEARSRDLCPLPAGERAARFCYVMEWVRGFGSVITARNPLTPTLSPNGEREPTVPVRRHPL